MLNKVILIGRLTRDPELRTTPQGVSVCTFSLAVQRRYKDASGERPTDFINCVAWRSTADFISKYFTKGQMMAVEGSIQTRSWDDNEGKKRYATEVLVTDASFIESKRDREGQEGGGNFIQDSPDGIFPLETEDDLPF